MAYVMTERTCPNCGKVFKTENRKKVYCCETCYHQFNARKRAEKLRNGAQAAGLCTRCRKAPALPGQNRCADCIERDKAAWQKYKANKGARKECKIFNCDHFHENRCCYYCRKRNSCPSKRRGPCYNSPDKCRQYVGDKNLDKGEKHE